MTLPRLADLYAHWRRHPRTEWLVARYLGYKAPAGLGDEPKAPLSELAAMFGQPVPK